MRACISIILLVLALKSSGQQLDSIYFNLYTDSLKKGTFNYINVEGKYDDGRYLPLTNKDLKFTSSTGTFEGNSLFIDTSFKGEKVTVKVECRSNRSLQQEVVVYIKKFESALPLPTMNEVMESPSRKKPQRRRG